MASVNYQKKIIYIHLPKTAGSYIQHILLKNYEFIPYNYLCFEYKNCVFSYKDKSIVKYYNDPEILDLISLSQDKIKEFKKFTFVRNPYHRFISAWQFMMEKGFISKNTTINELIINRDKYDGLVYNHFFVSQTEHLEGWNFDEIGKFENIEEDLKFILRDYGFNISHIPSKKNETKDYGDPSQYYSKEFLEFINSNFNDDFLNFGYEKILKLNDY